MKKIASLVLATALAASGATITLYGEAKYDLTGTWLQITTFAPPGDGCCISTTWEQSWPRSNTDEVVRLPYTITFPKLELPPDAEILNIHLSETVYPVWYRDLKQVQTTTVTPLCAGASCDPTPTHYYSFGFVVESPDGNVGYQGQPSEQQLRNGTFKLQNNFVVGWGEIGGGAIQVGRDSKTVNRWETNETIFHRGTIVVDYTVPASQIPEPGTFLLCGAGMMLLALRRKS